MEAMTQDMVARIKSHSQWAREHLDDNGLMVGPDGEEAIGFYVVSDLVRVPIYGVKSLPEQLRQFPNLRHAVAVLVGCSDGLIWKNCSKIALVLLP